LKKTARSGITCFTERHYIRDTANLPLYVQTVPAVIKRLLSVAVRLTGELSQELSQAKEQYEQTGIAARVFKDFTYQTLDSWSCSRRVVGKAEHLDKGQNPRFVVTSLSQDRYDACCLYEQLYCGRGDMENRIKEQQLCLFADRTSAATMRSSIFKPL